MQNIGLVHGDGPVPYSEIQSWSDLTGIKLNIWEVETLSSLSRAYLLCAQDSTKENVQPPFMTEEGVKAQQKAYALRRKAELTRGK